MKYDAMQVWLNDRVLPLEQAHISPFDRGFLFGDGVYEMVRFFDGVGMAMPSHLSRLQRSLHLARIEGFTTIHAQQAMLAVLHAESLRDATVYLQVTRGAAPTRTHLPPTELRPTSFAYAVPRGSLETLQAPTAIAVSMQPDERWLRCEIKSTSLMGTILPMLAGREHEADEALLVRDGLLSEGSTSNVLMVKHGVVVTPPLNDDPAILHGTMREFALEAAEKEGIPVEIRRVREAELRAADEIVIVSSSRVLASVTRLDGKVFGGGEPGPIASQLLRRMRLDLRAVIAAANATAD